MHFMKNLLLAISVILGLTMSACNNDSTNNDSVIDSTDQEGSIPLGDQSGTNDRMNNTSDNPDASTSDSSDLSDTSGDNKNSK